MSFATPIESATISEIEITVTLEVKGYNRILKCYHGKSTRPVTRKQNVPNYLAYQKIEMENEAKNAALMECFRDHLGFTEFNDLAFDELHRPLKETKLRSKMIK